MKDKIIIYLNSNNHYWWTVGLLPGVYALSYLYSNNYTLVNSWTQFLYLSLYLILAPSLLVAIVNRLIKNSNDRIKEVFNSSAFIINTAITLSLVIYLGWRWKALILVGIVAVLMSWFIGKHYKKGVLLLVFMSILGIGQFAYYFFTDILQKENWVKESTLPQLEFKKKPNIYYIQPDGYAGKTALENVHYHYDNYDFYQELIPRGFHINHDYRSNYPSTLTSNAALFTGQHHFYENGDLKNELFNARQIIMGDNPVLRSFKNNGYETTAILQHRYLLLNHPEVAYDRINIEKNEMSILPNYWLDKDYLADLKKAIDTASTKPQFYFIEILEPGHITGLPSNNTTAKNERDIYINKLNAASLKLYDMVDSINKNDPDSIIIIAADHGGFVGYNYATESYINTTNNVTLHQGIFNSLFAIKAPSGFEPYQENIKSSISLFPTLFSFLAEKPVVNDKIDNSSYQLIKNGTQSGIYRYYDDEGNSITEKLQ